MDKKIEMLQDIEIWESLMPKWIEKGISPDVLNFLANPENRFGVIQMIIDGEWEIAPPHQLLVPKDNGEYREVWCLSDLDRCIMSTISEIYYRLYFRYVHSNCVSYQKAKGVPSILHKICHHLGDSGYKVDLTKYFDSVNREKLDETLKFMWTDSPIDHLLWGFYHDDRVWVDDQLIEHYKSLAQGCAFSALLANLCLRDVDEELSGLCTVYCRYCDDILLLGDRSEEALNVLQERLHEFGLKLNPNKVEKIDEDSEFKFLGGMISKDSVHLTKKCLTSMKKSIKKCCRGLKANSRKEQKRAIRRIQALLFCGDKNNHHSFEWLASICTDSDDIKVLDEYAKDSIKAVFTGKHNHATNAHKTSNELLCEFGWFSLVNLWNARKYHVGVYKALLKKQHENYVIPLNVPNALEFAEERWETAKLYEGTTILNTDVKTNRIYSKAELSLQWQAVMEIESAIRNSKWVWEGRWFVQSERYPELVLLRSWFTA